MFCITALSDQWKRQLMDTSNKLPRPEWSSTTYSISSSRDGFDGPNRSKPWRRLECSDRSCNNYLKESTAICLHTEQIPVYIYCVSTTVTGIYQPTVLIWLGRICLHCRCGVSTPHDIAAETKEQARTELNTVVTHMTNKGWLISPADIQGHNHIVKFLEITWAGATCDIPQAAKSAVMAPGWLSSLSVRLSVLAQVWSQSCEFKIQCELHTGYEAYS